MDHILPFDVSRCLSSLLACLLGLGAAGAAAAEPLCSGAAKPILVLDFTAGRVEVELAAAAAPEAVATVARLARGPLFAPELTAGNPFTEAYGYYDGLEVAHVLRGTEVVTAVRSPRRAVLVANRIDAAALGLDQRRLTDPAEAMDLWQHTLMPHYANARSQEAISPQLVEWAKETTRTGAVDFLLTASRQEVLEALGHRFVTGLPSLPVTRGAVSLDPYNARWATPGLHFSLRDRPELDGKHLVIGRVTAGLEVVESLSLAEVVPGKGRRHRPQAPAVITMASFTCREAAAQATEEGESR